MRVWYCAKNVYQKVNHRKGAKTTQNSEVSVNSVNECEKSSENNRKIELLAHMIHVGNIFETLGENENNWIIESDSVGKSMSRLPRPDKAHV